MQFNYRHLYYFWVVAQEGGISKAAARLGMAVQTVSAQVRALEHSLGQTLLQPAGRGLVLSEAGKAAMRQADIIFQLGQELPDRVRDAVSTPTLRLAVGISDGLPKLVVCSLMQPVIQEPNLRLLCREADFDTLLADLALHRLDMVLADRPVPTHGNLKLYSHPLGSSSLNWYASPVWHKIASKNFPHSLEHVPVLLPTHHVAVRARLDSWFERVGLRPRVVGEFEDSALLKTFGASGMGVFTAPQRVHDELVARYAVRQVGTVLDVEERFYLIGTERKISHPLVQRLTTSLD